MAAAAQGGDVVTLQFGKFSNFVGTHYWNLQDELLGAQSQEVDDARGIDVSGLYRASGTGTHRRFTPRVLIYDQRTSLGSLLSSGYSQGDATTAAPRPDAALLRQTWGGGVVEHGTDQPAAKHNFQTYLESESGGGTAAAATAAGGAAGGGGGGGGGGGDAGAGGASGGAEQDVSEQDFNFDDTVQTWSDYLKA
jgi:hypothetical protein